jgi:hypothetical protein
MLEGKGSKQRAMRSTRSLAGRREFDRKDGTHSCGDISDTLSLQAAGRPCEQVRVVACEHRHAYSTERRHATGNHSQPRTLQFPKIINNNMAHAHTYDVEASLVLGAWNVV